MKKFALILFVLIVPVLLFGCANGTKLQNAITNKKENTQKFENAENTNPQVPNTDQNEQPTFLDRVETLIVYLNDYDCYNFTKYINYGIPLLISHATNEELDSLELFVEEIEAAIENNEDLYQEEYEFATGAAKKVYDMDELLYTIFHRATE